MLSLALKLVRFAVVGLSSALLYALVVALLLWSGGQPLLVMHCIAFALSIPYAYFAQRGFTFRHDGLHAIAFPRFLMMALLGFILSTCVVAVAKALRFDDVIAITAVLIVVPAFNFACMWGWVFVEQDQPPGAKQQVAKR